MASWAARAREMRIVNMNSEIGVHRFQQRQKEKEGEFALNVNLYL